MPPCRAALCAALPLALASMAAGEARADDTPLQLAVMLNGRPTDLVGSFVAKDQSVLGATRRELGDIGVEAAAGADDEWIDLSAIPGVTYRLDEPGQTVWIDVDNDHLRPHMIEFSQAPPPMIASSAGYGGLLNYTLYGSGATEDETQGWLFNGASAQLDARLYSPFGYLTQSGILGTTTDEAVTALRLDTTYVYSDQARALTYRAGDLISGTPDWARPVRLGGLQLARAFELRPDIVTAPLPTVNGTAAVPSTLDIFINNVRSLSRDVPAGPYQIDNLPMVSGGGAARIVVTDASGRQIETSVPFYASLDMLHEGLFDFSVDVGVPRFSYSTESFDYGTSVVGTGHARYGLTNWLTLAAYGEFGSGLVNAGAGATASLAGYGVASLAMSGSSWHGDVGAQLYAAFETTMWGSTLYASTIRTFGDFEDLSSVTAPARGEDGFDDVTGSISGTGLAASEALILSLRPPKALDRVSWSTPVAWTSGTVAASFIHAQTRQGPSSKIVTASYVRNVGRSGTLSASLFSDLSEGGSFGASLSYSVAFGDDGTRVETGFLFDQGKPRATIGASRPLGLEPGSFGWDVEAGQGLDDGFQSARAAYRSGTNVVAGRLQHSGGAIRGEVAVDGAIIASPDGVFLSNRIDDAFAVVDVGAPDVEVFAQNRPVGRSNAAGKIVIPNLVPNQPNTIAIDPAHLPLDAAIGSTQEVVMPMSMTGVSVSFGVHADAQAASVTILDADGQPVKPGAIGENLTTGETFVVGYDGLAYLPGLQPANDLRISVGDAACTASFARPATAGATLPQSVVCR